MADKCKGLNPKQAKFVSLYTGGGMSRSEAYMEAYGQENQDTARKNAASLIVSNCDVKAEIDRILGGTLDRVKERFLAEADETVDKYFDLRAMANPEYAIQLRVCLDHLDRIGFKPVEQIEHSGEVQVNLMDIILERKRQAEGE